MREDPELNAQQMENSEATLRERIRRSKPSLQPPREQTVSGDRESAAAFPSTEKSGSENHVKSKKGSADESYVSPALNGGPESRGIGATIPIPSGTSTPRGTTAKRSQHLPHSEVAEKGILCALLNKPEMIAPVVQQSIGSEHFHLPTASRPLRHRVHLLQ